MKNFKERRKMKQEKRSMLSRFLIAMFSIQLIFALNVYGQQMVTVNGTVTDAQGQPLPGATVLEEGTTNGTVTNSDGNYTINVPGNATLQFSFVGMTTQSVAVNSRSQINIQMAEETIGLEEVVAIGYGVQKAENITSSVASVKSEDFVEGNVSDVAQLIKGKVSGLSIVNPSGDPLSGSQITLRGVTTLSSGTQPLILIDGVPGDLNSISEENIETITVLKSGAAAAIYGTRATNGVLLIQTKGVTSDIEPTITVKMSATTERIKKKPDLLTASEFRELVNTGDPYTPGQGDYGANTDWLDEITRNPYSYRLDVNMRGGNTRNNYGINIQQKDIQGIMIDTNNKETKLLLKGVHTMFDNVLKIDANMIGYLQSYNRAYGNLGTTAGRGTPYTAAMKMNPTQPIKDENGEWVEDVGQKDIDNPVALIKENTGAYENALIQAYGTLSLRPIDDLILELRGSLTTDNHTGGSYYTQNHISAKRGQHNGRASRNTSRSKDELIEFIATYDKNIDEHDIGVVGGYTWEQSIWENYSMTNSDFPSDIYRWNNIGIGTQLRDGNANMSSYKAQTNLAGFFGRISYNFRDKYYLMASLRHEGSSKFGVENKWGNFPGVSGGWHLGREPFMSDLDFLSHLKLRADYGITGTAPSSPYQSIPRLNLGTQVYLGGEWGPAVIPVTNENPNLRWERKKEFNIGLDFGFLDDRFSVSADYYQRITDGLIWNYVVPQPPYLYNSILANAGEIENTGIELNINATLVEANNFSWNSNLNFSYNKNLVSSLRGDEFKVEGGYFDTGSAGISYTASHRIEEGKPVGNFYGYKSIGIDDDGFLIIEGKDGSPKSINDKNPDDKQYLGNGLPDYYLNWNNTIRFKNFALDIGMSSAFGFQILNQDKMFQAHPEAIIIGNALHDLIEPVYGKRTLNVQHPLTFASYYIEDGDYLKIDNASLSYSLTPNNSFVKNMNVFLNGFNLYTFTKYSGIDPEVNVLGLSPGLDEKRKYPKTMSFSLGVNIIF
jgi:TonB-dependent starch-binding outer membrane protein SusC